MSAKIEELVAGEAQRLPSEIKRFVGPFREHRVLYLNFEDMAHSYGRAFNKLAEDILDDVPQWQLLLLPTLFLARHAIELHLKWAIEEYQIVFKRFDDDYASLGLKEHWNTLVELVRLAGVQTNDHSTYCLQLLSWIDEIDPDTAQFRYPYDMLDGEFAHWRSELENVIKAHWHVSTYTLASTRLLKEFEKKQSDDGHSP